MKCSVVQKEKVTVTDNFCLGPHMQVQIGSFIHYTPQSGHHIELRVLVGTEDHFRNRTPETILYIQQFESIPLTAIVGNVIVPAQELLTWYRRHEMPLDYRDIALHAILAYELQEVRFDLDRRKSTCELWFRCLKARPWALIPKDMLNRDHFLAPAN